MKNGLPSKLSRRNFLVAVSAGGAAGAAALAAKNPPAPGVKTDAASGSKGYRLTEHIRKYYGTANV